MSAWREKEPLRVRPELFEAGRLQEKSRSVFDGRSVVIDVITQECFLIILAVAYSHVRVQGSLPRVGVMGAGHVGTALIMKLLKNNYPAKFVSVSTRQPEKIQKCEALNSAQNQNLFENVQRHNDNARLSRESDVLVLAIPPSKLKSVSIQIKHSFSSSHSASFVISTLAGVPLEHIQKSCGTILAFRTKIYVPFILQQKKGSYCAEELAAGEMGKL
jgi:glycerol-3-phosphate dehydrogenase